MDRKGTHSTAFCSISTTDTCIFIQFNISLIVIKTWIFVNLENFPIKDIIFNVPCLWFSLLIVVINCFDSFRLYYWAPCSPLNPFSSSTWLIRDYLYLTSITKCVATLFRCWNIVWFIGIVSTFWVSSDWSCYTTSNNPGVITKSTLNIVIGW